MVAGLMNFPPQSHPTAASEIRTVFEQNMAEYLTTYMDQMRKRNLSQAQMPPGQFAGPQGSPTPSQPLERTPQPSVPPAPPGFPANPQHQQRPSSVSSHASPSMNNISTPDAHLSPNASRLNDVAVPPPPASLTNRASTSSIPHVSPHQSVHKLSPQVSAPQPDRGVPPSSELEKHYDAKHDKFLTYAGFTLNGTDDKPASMPDKAHQLAHLKDRLLGYEYLGPVDLHALGMSLQSGIPSEISNALGQILSLSWHPFALAEYEDFVDILLEFGDSQVSLLSAASDAIIDVNEITSFETLTALVKLEPGCLEELPRYTQDGRALDRAAERLVDVTMILSNLSHTDPNRTSPIYEGNRKLISVPAVIELVLGVVELFSCRENVFRTPKHATDIMKNLITYLSNISDLINFSSEGEALSLMRFLTAFAPAHSSSDFDGDNSIRFGVYEPQTHPYLPCAVDTLAKLLVKDDPNRAFYRAIFQAEAATTPIPRRLLTGAFALAIAPIPEDTIHIPSALRISDMRKPFFIQGMLAADILASMTSTSGPVARQWLCSDDDWAVHLHHLIIQMAQSRRAPLRQRRAPPQDRPAHRRLHARLHDHDPARPQHAEEADGEGGIRHPRPRRRRDAQRPVPPRGYGAQRGRGGAHTDELRFRHGGAAAGRCAVEAATVMPSVGEEGVFSGFQGVWVCGVGTKKSRGRQNLGISSGAFKAETRTNTNEAIYIHPARAVSSPSTPRSACIRRTEASTTRMQFLLSLEIRA